MTSQSLGRRVVHVLGLQYRLRRRWRRSTTGEREISRLRTVFYRSVWEEAAAAVGGSVQPLQGSLLEVRCPGVRLLVQKNVTSLDDPITVAMAMDKPLVSRLLARRGIPVPRHEVCRFDDVPRAWRFVSTVGRPCVVKPAKYGIGGFGITCGVRTRLQLAMAMAHARAVDTELLIEEMIEGEVFRLLYLDGELLDAVLRSPPSVVGDGVSTIRRLVEKDNADRLRQGTEAAQTMLKLDRELKSRLRDRGLRLTSVPPAGEAIRLKRVVNDNRREDNRPAMDDICPALATVGAEAAAAVGVRLAGVDVITRDPSLPLFGSGGAVIEVNSGPGLYYHYMKAETGVPVAAMILERLMGSQSQTGDQKPLGR